MMVRTDTGYCTGTGEGESRSKNTSGNADPPAHVQHYFVLFFTVEESPSSSSALRYKVHRQRKEATTEKCLSVVKLQTVTTATITTAMISKIT